MAFLLLYTFLHSIIYKELNKVMALNITEHKNEIKFSTFTFTPYKTKRNLQSSHARQAPFLLPTTRLRLCLFAQYRSVYEFRRLRIISKAVFYKN